jgi:hypothetical protein
VSKTTLPTSFNIKVRFPFFLQYHVLPLNSQKNTTVTLKETNRHNADNDLLQERYEDVYYILELKHSYRQDSDKAAAEGDKSEAGDELLETRSMQSPCTAPFLTRSR